MSLNDLNRELYSADPAAVTGRTHEQSAFEPTVAGNNPPASPFEGDQHWNEPQKGFSASQKRNIWIGVSIFFLIVLAVGGVFFYQWWVKNAFHQDRVSISFEGPKEIDSTQQTKYVIHYANNNRVTLKDVQLELKYSENFQPSDNLNLKYLSPSTSRMSIGDIKPMTSGQVELKGTFYAPKDTPVFVHGELSFTPSNGSSQLSMENQIGVNITAAPVFLSVIAPKDIVSGEDFEYLIDYKNMDIKSIADAQIRIDFPADFQLSSATPKPSEKSSYWYLGNLESNQGGKIVISGKMKGNSNEIKNAIVSLGHVGDENNFIVYNKQELATKVISPILIVQQKLKSNSGNVVTAGEMLKYEIAYYNSGDVALRDVIITAEINSKLLDFSKIKIPNGSYDGSTNLITWKASGVPGLANIGAKGGGTVDYEIPIKSIIPVESEIDKNFTISSIAKIDSPDVLKNDGSNRIMSSNKLDLKLDSKVLFTTTGYYIDKKIKNLGPIPMVTGSETTFALHWSVATISNDIADGVVTATLPSGVRWTNKFFPVTEKIDYNERTNQISWKVGNVPAGTGVLLPRKEIVFQVGVTPQANQIGGPIMLLNKSNFTAKDTFVDRQVSIENEEKNSRLIEDPSVGYKNGTVAN